MQILATSLHADDDDDDGVGPWLFGLCILQSKRVAPRASATEDRVAILCNYNPSKPRQCTRVTCKDTMYICDADDDGPRAS